MTNLETSSPPATSVLTNLETSSPPATSFQQDDTLTYAVFVLDTLNYFCYWLMLAKEPVTLC